MNVLIARTLVGFGLGAAMPWVLFWAFVGFPTLISAAPFLSSAAYPDSGAQPTEFLVSVDDTAEAESAAAHLKHTYTITLTAYDAATTYKVTIGGADVTQIGTGGTTTTTATALTTALNASADANFTPITWTSSGAVITGIHDVPGTAYVPTTSKTGGTGTIGAPVETAEPDEAFLLYDLEGITFGTHIVSVKAQNDTSTSTAATLSFDVGVETPDLIIIPGAP